MRRLVLVFGLLGILAGIVSAQTFGSIQGVVQDPSGAFVPNATVTVTNTATSVARTTTTNANGLYVFPDLVPGTYNVQVVASGFSTVTKQDILVQVQQAVRADFALQVGQATESIEVAANAALLSTENATVGTVIEEQRIMDLPLNGRSYFSLVGLSPNVTTGFVAPAQASGRLGGSRGSLTIAVTGGRTTWENYTLDGVTNTDIDFNTYILQPSVDALQEFKVQSGIYPAEFGRELGQVNAATKPGTNEFHGAIWEFLRNDKLDAVPYDFRVNPTTPAVKSPYKQNQYGYELGGPVRIPKIINGKNRLFFMSNFEEFNSRQTTPSLITTMPAAMRQGDFSSILSAGYVIYDPSARSLGSSSVPADQLASVLATQAPFPNNQIPQSRIAPDSTLLLNKWNPLPNLAQTTAGLPYHNYQYGLTIPADKDTLTERIDLNESSKSQWFGRYSWNDESTLENTGQITDDGEVLYTRASQWVLSNVRTISPTKVNEVRFGYSNLFNNITQQLAGKENVNTELNMPVSPSDPNSYGIPNINFLNGNLASYGNPTSSPFQINDKYFEWVDNFSWVHGNHSFRFGGEYRYNEFPQVGNEFPRGQFYFDGRYTNKVLANGTGSNGWSGADMLLGDPYEAIIAVSLASDDFRSSEAAGYIDDTWRVHPHLTLSLGFRWEMSQPLLDVSGREPNVQLQEGLPNVADVADPNLQPVFVRTGTGGNFYNGINFRYAPYWSTAGLNPLPAVLNPLQTVQDGRMGNRLINTNYHDFAPRIGIAYSPNDKWSIRLGYGIFYNMESKNSIFDLGRGMGGRATTLASTTYAPPTFTYTNFLNTANLPVTVPVSLTWGAAQHLPDTSTQQFVFNVQRMVGANNTAEIGYTGSVSRHLAFLLDENQGILSATLPTQLRLPYPEWGASGIQYVMAAANGNYNSLRAQWTTKISNNLNALLGYTWSRALDDTSSIRGSVGADFSPQNALCPTTCEYGPSDFNVPQRFVASILYTLPFGKGQHFLNKGGVVNQVVGGWQLSTITTLQSGMPIDTSSWDSGGTNFISNATRLNCVPGVNPVLPGNNQNAWFNPAAFSNPVAGTFGTCSRNELRGPWLGNEDVSVVKYFQLAERKTLEFRTEMFNAPNHVLLNEGGQLSWGNGSSATPSASFTKIQGTWASMRQIQFALKLSF
ncbi:MAG TPA: carboxypeptidase-like regulatory domain-containing protein [Bryobacteraceae bacterium]|nr:carboxypeptidase-like regulatory domain-containing protein [Bryobacteraceae bacterium]